MSSLYRRLAPDGVAIASVGIAILLSLWLQPWLDRTIGAFFYIAVIVSASSGGIRSGIVATVLATLAIDYIFVSPVYQFSIREPGDIGRLAIFLFVASVINLLSSSLRLNRYKVEKLSQQLLNESRDRLKIALSAAHMGLWDWNLVTGEIVWSPEHEQLFGLTPGSFDGKYETFEACLHLDDRKPLKQAVQFALQNQTSYQQEFRVIWADGSVHWVEGRGQAAYDAAGQAVRMSGTVMQIDDRRQTEIALTQSEQRFRSLVEQSPLATMRFTSDGFLLSVNAAWETMWNSPAAVVKGYNILGDPQIAAIGDMPAVQRAFAGEAIDLPARFYDPALVGNEGCSRWVEPFLYPIKDQTGQLLEVVLVSKDVTARKHAELALMQSEQQFRAIFEAEPEWIKIMTAEGTLQTINPAGLAMIEVDSLEQAVGQCVCPLIASSHQQAFLAFIQQVAQGKPGILEFEMTGMRGTRRWLESHAVPLPTVDAIPLVLAVTRDITERKQATLALQQLMEDLEQRVRERTNELQQANDRLHQELFQRLRIERELQESASSLRSLYQVIAARHQSFEQRIQDLLAMGCQLFGLEFGVLARVQHGQYQVMVARSPHQAFKPGDTLDVKQTLCCEVLDRDEPLAIEHVGASEWRHHPAYATLQMECYIGARVLVDGETHGTISFASKTPSVDEFRPAHKELLKLMAQWIGAEIERQQAETELRQMSTALENAVAGISRLDTQGRYIAVNAAYAHAAGYEPEEMIGMDWQKTVHPDDLEKLLLAYQQMQQNGKVEVEAKGIRQDGSIFYKQLVMISAYDEQQQFVGHHCFMKDITDRKQFEAALRQGESTLRSFFNSSSMMMGIVELHEDDIKHLSDNATTAQFFGTTQAAMQNQFASAMGISRTQLDFWLRHYREAQQTQAPVRFEYAHPAPDGQKWLSATVCAIAAPSDQPTRCSYIVEDISDRKQAEADLQESNRRWRSLLDNVQLVVVGLDINGNVEYANPFFLQLVGYDLEDVLGRSWFDGFLSSGQRQPVEICFREVLEYSFHVHYQNPILTRSGEERMIAWNNTVLRDASGQPIGTISIGEDITERYKLERMKTEFVAVVSHELRTPLTSMQAALSLLVEKIINPTSEEGEIIIQIAAEGVDRLVRLVNDILDLERLDSGKIRLEKRLCNPAHLMAIAADQMQEMANQAGIQLDVESNAIEIHADPDRLLQVLTNLLSNAIKFSPNGSSVGLSVELQPNEQPALLFTVKDQGRGIPAHKLDAIFERFQQVDASDSREKGGTGLGLAICHAIVEQHGGHIWVESILEQGSTFYFTIPIAASNSDERQASFDD